MERQMGYKTNAAVLTDACYSAPVNALTPTLIKLKFFMTLWPMSQSPETDVNLAIRPKKIISNMMVLNTVINKNKWCVNCVSLFFPFA